jgi:hypothetical protein
MEGSCLMFDVFLVNFGYTHSSHKTLAAAVKAAKKTGFQCSIFNSKNPFDLVQWVSPVGGGR